MNLKTLIMGIFFFLCLVGGGLYFSNDYGDKGNKPITYKSNELKVTALSDEPVDLNEVITYSRITHQYTDTLIKDASFLSFEKLDVSATYNPNRSNEVLVKEGMTSEEHIRLFYDENIIQRNLSFFEAPHFIETYYLTDEEYNEYELSDANVYLYSKTNKNEPFVMYSENNGNIQIINGHDFYADYNKHYDGFTDLEEKDINDMFFNNEVAYHDAYFNPYKTLSNALQSGQSSFYPFGDENLAFPFEYDTTFINRELHITFYLTHESFFKSDAYYEFNGQYKFVFDESMNLIRFKKYFMGDETIPHRLEVHYGLYYLSEKEFFENHFDKRLADVFINLTK